MKELMNYRYYVLLVILGVAMTLGLSECPEGETFGGWVLYHITLKTFAVVCFGIVYLLVEIWKDKLPLFGKIQELTTSIIEK